MADDWIKIRQNLLTHPKLVRIMCATCATRLQTLGALITVWGIFDTHTEDGRLEGYTPAILDEMVGQPGISDAMRMVGWLEYEPDDAAPDAVQALIIPRFQLHNGKSAKRRAMNAERMRNARLNTGESAHDERTSVRDLCAKRAQNENTECAPEKRREDINNKGSRNSENSDQTELPFADPEFAEAWETWLESRRQRKKPVTLIARKLQLKKLADMGRDRAVAALTHSAMNGYQGIFEPHSTGYPSKNFGNSAPAAQTGRATHRVKHHPEPEGDWRAAVAAEYGEIPATTAWSSFPEEVQRDLLAVIANAEGGAE